MPSALSYLKYEYGGYYDTDSSKIGRPSTNCANGIIKSSMFKLFKDANRIMADPYLTLCQVGFHPEVFLVFV